MNEATAYSPPEIILGESTEDAWSRERRAFQAVLPALLSTHAGEFVAIHNGSVVARGTDRVDVAQKAYARVGYVPVYLGHVSESGSRPVRIASPRLPRNGDGR